MRLLKLSWSPGRFATTAAMTLIAGAFVSCGDLKIEDFLDEPWDTASCKPLVDASCDETGQDGMDGDQDSDQDCDTGTDSPSSDVDTASDTGSDPEPDGDTGDTSPGEDGGIVDGGTDIVDTETTTDDGGCLLISEYVEGSANNKGIELFNCGVSDVDLGNYSLCLFSNQGTSCKTELRFSDQNETDDSRLLLPGEVVTVCHTSADEMVRCDYRSNVCNFNGDDRLALLRRQNVVDAFGELGVCPEDLIWADVTFRRCAWHPFPGDQLFDAQMFYRRFAQDDFSGFGFPPSEGDASCESDSDPDSETDEDDDSDPDQIDAGEDDSDSDSSAHIDAAVEDGGDDGEDTDSDTDGAKDCLIISEIIEGSGWNKGIEIFNCSENDIDLTGYSTCLITNDNTNCGATLYFSDFAGNPELVILPADEVRTICHGSADLLLDACQIQSGVAAFSGDDRILVQKGELIIDAFGETAVRPEGSPWADLTLRRCSFDPYLGIGSFDLTAYYLIFDRDDFTDFGLPPFETECW